MTHPNPTRITGVDLNAPSDGSMVVRISVNRPPRDMVSPLPGGRIVNEGQPDAGDLPADVRRALLRWLEGDDATPAATPLRPVR